MPLTPNEILQRRLSDPYFGLAESQLGTSLSEQKKQTIASANVEKRRKLDPAAQAADEAQQSLADAYSHLNVGGNEAGLLDIAQSALYQSREQIFDMVSGHEAAPGVDRNRQIQEYGDFEAGVTETDRERLVGAPQQQVVESLAAGNYGDAFLQSLAAAPGTLADSAGVVPELALGALATYVTGGAAAPVFARRLQKGAQAFDKVTDAVDKAKKAKKSTKLFTKGLDLSKDAVKAIPKAAGQVSIATADITQRQINDFTKEHGVAPTRAEAAQMYALNLATMLPQPAILKNFFVPKFAKEIGKEIQTIGKNLVGGSNFGSIVSRVLDGTKKVATAGGAEAAQEYFQTWAENLNVGMGPEQRKNFAASLKEIVSSEDAQLQAMVGAFLGGGAGVGARAAITVPAVVAGTAVDTVKGTVKTATKIAASQANKASLKVLNEEERAVLRSEHESRKKVAGDKIADIDTNIEVVRNAENLQNLKGNAGTASLVNALQVKNELTDQDLADPKQFDKFRKELERTYKADKLTIQAEVETSNIAAIATKAGTNVKDKAVEAARDVVASLDVDVDAVVEQTKRYGKATVNAVKSIESSVGLGVIELAGRKTKEASATALKAAQDLSLNDLNAVSSVVDQFDPKLGKKLRRLAKQKVNALKRTGLKRGDILSAENLPPIIADTVKAGRISPENAGAGATALNQAIASTISDVDTLEQIEGALKAYKNSTVFKQQTAGSGVMSPESMAALESKLGRKAVSLRRPKRKKVAKIIKRIEEKGILPTLNDTAVVKKLAEAYNSKTAQDLIEKIKQALPDLEELQTEEGQAALEAKIEAGLKKAKTVVTGPETESTAQPVDESTAVTIGPKFTAKLKLIEEATKTAEGTSEVITNVDKLYQQMKKGGIETRAQWNSLLEQFPGLRNNEQFFKKLDGLFPDPVAYNESTDNQATTEFSDVEIKEKYNNSNPKECNIP